MLPDTCSQSDDGCLVGLQGDLGQLEGVPADAVAELVVEHRVVGAHLNRYADLPQLLLVALEHALEGVIALVAVALDHLAQTFSREVAPCDQ